MCEKCSIFEACSIISLHTKPNYEYHEGEDKFEFA